MQPSRSKKSKPRFEVSRKAMIIVISALAGVGVIGGGIWAYFAFTTMPPPDMKVAKAEDVATFLGSERGFARLNSDRKEAFLVRTFENFGQGERRTRLVRSLSMMSTRERKVLFDASADLFRERTVEQARQFNKLSSSGDRQRFVDHAIKNFGAVRRPFMGQTGGSSGGGDTRVREEPIDLGTLFKGVLPQGQDEIMQTVINKTTASDRAEIKPFVDAVSSRIKELRESKR